MTNKIIFSLMFGFALCVSFGTSVVFAEVPAQTARFFNGPTVTNVGNTSANVSLSSSVLGSLSEEEKQQVYFEYIETHLVCIMIYPTPESCLPKKTKKGVLSHVLTDLKPNTEYTVLYKKDTNIVCIKEPCNTNEFTSLSVNFTTTSDSAGETIKRNLYLGTSGKDVVILQNKLIEKGYLKSGTRTGFFGPMTLRAVREFQKKEMKISPTGVVGAKTRAALFSATVTKAIKFSGKLEKVSTACFADGICSVTVSGKTIVTTRGWSQEVVGKVLGVDGFGDLEKYLGSTVNVYAKETEDGYTLYGSTDYYVELVK